jgi:hypothetical protein
VPAAQADGRTAVMPVAVVQLLVLSITHTYKRQRQQGTRAQSLLSMQASPAASSHASLEEASCCAGSAWAGPVIKTRIHASAEGTSSSSGNGGGSQAVQMLAFSAACTCNC